MKLLINQLFVPEALAVEVEDPLQNIEDLQIDQSCPQILHEDLAQAKESDNYGLPPRPTSNSTYGISLTSGRKGKPCSMVFPQETDDDAWPKTESQIISEEYALPDYSANKRSFVTSPQFDRTTLSPSTDGKNRSASKTFEKPPSDKMLIKLLSSQSDKLVQSIKENTASIVEEVMEDKFEAIQKVVLAEMNRIISKKAQEIKEHIEEKYEDCLKYQKFLIHYSEKLKPKMKDAQLQAYIPEPQVIAKPVVTNVENTNTTQDNQSTVETQPDLPKNKTPAKTVATAKPINKKESLLKGRKNEFINKKMNEYLSKSPTSEKVASPKSNTAEKTPYKPFSSLLKNSSSVQKPKTETEFTIERSPRFVTPSIVESEIASNNKSCISEIHPHDQTFSDATNPQKGVNQSISFFIPANTFANTFAKPLDDRKSADETCNPNSLNLSHTENTSLLENRDILKESNSTSIAHSHRDRCSNQNSTRRSAKGEGKENCNQQEICVKHNSLKKDEKNGVLALNQEKNPGANKTDDLVDSQEKNQIVRQIESAFENMSKVTSFPTAN